MPKYLVGSLVTALFMLASSSALAEKKASQPVVSGPKLHACADPSGKVGVDGKAIVVWVPESERCPQVIKGRAITPSAVFEFAKPQPEATADKTRKSMITAIEKAPTREPF